MCHDLRKSRTSLTNYVCDELDIFIYFNAALLKPCPKLPVTSRSIYTLLLLLNRHATLISLWFFCGPPPPGLNKFSQAQLRSPWSLTLCRMIFTVSSVSCKSLTFIQYTPTHSDAGVCMCMRAVNSLICMCAHTHSNTFLSIFHTVKHCISCAVCDQLVPRTRTVLVFDIALKSTEMASCFHPAQPHVNTLSTPGLITLSVYATLTQTCLCSFVRTFISLQG